MQNGGIKLVQYEQKYFACLRNYVLSEDQALYTSMPIDALKQCEIEKETIPVVVLYKSEIVGFFVLNNRKGANIYTGDEQVVLFKSFSIDQRFQGRKFAKEALYLLADFAKNMNIEKNDVILTVHHTNLPAINLYKKCGFIDNGVRYDGEYGEELVLHLPLK